MLSIFDSLRDTDILSVTIRLVLAVLCGGIIGLERERKRRPAGFRTHILICIGAALTTITSQFLFLNMNMYTDMARLGAQVIAGIGFIGAGTIIVTKRKQVKGLTTAAGFWASAIIGLTIGCGYYEAAIYATVLILIVELLFAKLEYRIISNAKNFNIFVEYTTSEALSEAVAYIEEMNIKILDMEITKSAVDEGKNPCAIFSLQFRRKTSHSEVIEAISNIENVISVEEL